jgi:predicted DNA-binding transcriptional regulator AlpA
MSEEQTTCELIRGYRALTALVPYSRNRIWHLIRAGKFPPPIELGANAVAWHREEIAAWLSTRPRRITAPKTTEAA